MSTVVMPGGPSGGPRLVFVYGTLRKGEVNDINRLAPAPVFVGRSTTHGTLYPLGWYPGLRLGGQGEVVGEIYAVEPELEMRLDEIEGLLPEPTGEYFKRDLVVRLDGRVLQCFVYEIAPELVDHLDPMAHGDWVLRDSSGGR